MYVFLKFFKYLTYVQSTCRCLFSEELVLADPELITRSFLERDNFETELGCSADDPFAEDFSDISRHQIVNVIADGDWVGRFVISNETFKFFLLVMLFVYFCIPKYGFRPIIVIYAYRLPSNKTFGHAKFLR